MAHNQSVVARTPNPHIPSLNVPNCIVLHESPLVRFNNQLLTQRLRCPMIGQLIRRMNVRISVQSEIRKGRTFSIKLPCLHT